METFDIILDSTGSFQTLNNDFKAGDNANNLIKYIVNANKGEFKEAPSFGVGINLQINGIKNIQEIERDIINELVGDVFPNPDVDMDEFPSIIRINKVVFEI
jgi:hypothetical protein